MSLITDNQGLVLRPLQVEDIEPMRLVRNANNAGYSSQAIITPEMQLAWFMTIKQNPPMTEFLAAVLNDELCGAIWYGRDDDFRGAELGRSMIFPQFKRMGLYTRIFYIVDAYVNPEFWWAYEKKDNEAAVKANAKLGWEIIGEKDDQYYIKNFRRWQNAHD